MKRIVLSLFFLIKFFALTVLGEIGAPSARYPLSLEQPFGMALFRNDLVISDRATGLLHTFFLSEKDRRLDSPAFRRAHGARGRRQRPVDKRAGQSAPPPLSPGKEQGRARQRLVLRVYARLSPGSSSRPIPEGSPLISASLHEFTGKAVVEELNEAKWGPIRTERRSGGH